MGQPPAVQKADPAMRVEARQYTGRIVTIANDKIFDNPVYNYTRYFPYLWEELHIMIKFTANRKTAEEIMLVCNKDDTGNLRKCQICLHRQTTSPRQGRRRYPLRPSI